MRILGIDPGTTETGWCIYNTENMKIIDKDKSQNESFLEYIGSLSEDDIDCVVYEMVACYGMPVGSSVFETVLWLGRFIERARRFETHRIYRKDVKISLCGSMKAKDGNIRQAILDMFPATGGGKTPQIGTKNNPGPLYGISGDIWAALALCIAYSRKDGE